MPPLIIAYQLLKAASSKKRPTLEEYQQILMIKNSGSVFKQWIKGSLQPTVDIFDRRAVTYATKHFYRGDTGFYINKQSFTLS